MDAQERRARAEALRVQMLLDGLDQDWRLPGRLKRLQQAGGVWLRKLRRLL